MGGGATSYLLDGERATAPPPAIAGTFPAASQALRAPDPGLPLVEVWKSPTCGCCSLWVEHMRRAGFEVQVVDLPDLTEVKHAHGVGVHLQACHTALVDGFVVEGHVPADDVKRLLEERPQVVGVAVPGMPIGSPGMEYGDVRQPYEVLTFDRNGRTTVWSRH